jgi:hypothetical protein
LTLVTQAEYAKLHGVSRKTVTKWKDGDYLILSEGKVDLEATDALLKEHRLGRFREGVTSKQGNKSTPAKPRPASPPRPVRISRPSDGYADDGEPPELDLFVHDTDDLIEDILAGRNLKASEAERIKENNLALKHILDMRERAGMLVETEKVETLFFETSRKARDAWMDWPTKVGPLIAADLGLEADVVVEVLTKYVQSQLEKLGDPGAKPGGEA